MKGVIFVEFISMLDELLGIEETEKLLLSCSPESGGAYTSIGTYSDSEMTSLIHALHKKTGKSISNLQKQFGRYLFDKFIKRYMRIMPNMENGFDLLKKIDDHIHVEVKKLYPEALLPRFDHRQEDVDTLCLVYRSKRKMPDLAEGLIEAAMQHFDEPCTIEQKAMLPDRGHVEFWIRKL